MILKIVTQLGWFVGLAFVATLERVVGLPGWYFLGMWWWTTQLPAGWVRVLALVAGGLWLAVVFNVPLSWGVALLASWYLAGTLLPTQASWQTVRLCLLVLVWMLLVAVLAKVPWSWLSVGYTLGVLAVVVIVSRAVVIWDQRLQLSAWWKYRSI